MLLGGVSDLEKNLVHPTKAYFEKKNLDPG